MASHARTFPATDHGAGWGDHRLSILPVVSQDLRTSLNVILGFVEMLADFGVAESEREEFVRRIRSEGRTLLDRVESTLAFGAPSESGGPALQRAHRARRRRARPFLS
jgi:signal transduction histidine kinase